jgi:hypothetical protein
MNPTLILIFILLVSILYVLVQRHKQQERDRLEKSKQLVTNFIKNIPKKMKKIMKKADETFPTGAVKLASAVADSQPGGKTDDKIIEAFEDIKDIRYGKIGASNHNGGNTINKWIKISSFTISGAWDARGLTLEVYPKIRNAGSSRQTLVCLVRNADKDIEEPYVSLTTHNESIPNTRLIKDVRVIRTGGSGISGNNVEIWIQFGQDWADSAYVMYYLYNFGTKDFVATIPQAQVDNPSAGQAWGVGEKIEPQNGKSVVKGTKIKIGDKWTMSGVGDAHGNDDWLRLFGTDEKGYSGGFAAGRLWTPELYLAGKVFGTAYVRGGEIGAESAGHEFRHANESQGIGLGYNTIYATGYNADQDLGLKARGNGKVRVKSDLCINDTCINEGSLKNLETKNRARFIRVGNKDASIRKDYWTLIELRAYDRNGNNVAAGKPVKILEGRKWADQTPPDRIVDGQIFDGPTALHDNWYKGYHGDTGLNVLEIDLGAEVDLSQVELFNRWNADIDWRMDGTTIEFIGADGNRNRIIYTGLWHRQYSKEYIL